MIQAAIVTVSDSVAAGTREDRSGPRLKERAEALNRKLAVIAETVGTTRSVLRSTTSLACMAWSVSAR